MICNRNHPDPRKFDCILKVPPLPAATSLPALAEASAKFNICMFANTIVNRGVFDSFIIIKVSIHNDIALHAALLCSWAL